MVNSKLGNIDIMMKKTNKAKKSERDKKEERLKQKQQTKKYMKQMALKK